LNILKKKDGKMVGCAFVQYSNVAEASKAIKELNGKPFLQRPVAIDWAVSKDRFLSENPKPAQPEPEIKEEEAENDSEEDMDTNEKDDNPLPSDGKWDIHDQFNKPIVNMI
jgi:nucleolar protein 4